MSPDLDQRDGRPVVLLLDADEARRFEAERPEVRAILALTPAAWAALGPDSRVILARDPIGDSAHARITARARRAARQFEAALDRGESLRQGTWYYLAFTLQCHAFITARVWELLKGPGPWLIPLGGAWQRFDSRAEAHAAYMERLRDYYPYVQVTPPANAAFRLLARIVLTLVRGRGRWVLTTRSHLIFGLDKLLQKAGLRIFTFEVRGSGIRDYLNLWHLLRDGLSGIKTLKLPLSVRPKPQTREVIRRAIEAISDPVMARGLTRRDRDSLVADAAYCEGLFDSAVEAIGTLKPLCYVNRQDSGYPGMVADAAGDAAVPRFVINYNSFPPSDSAVAQHLLRFFFHARMPEGLSDHFLMWSPHLRNLSLGVYSSRGVAATRPIRLEPPAMDSLARKPGPYRVLHASNFTEWGYFFPTIMETSLEFARDILALERAIDPLPEVELTIRTKPKGECNPETLRCLLPAATRAMVTGVEVPFPKALAEADLLVGYMSTTIEEALLARTPVLLWGPTERYRQLPARLDPPTPDDRAAVYGVRSRDELGPMVQAILEAHAGHPLTDEEIADHVWPEGTPTLQDLAETIAAGGQRGEIAIWPQAFDTRPLPETPRVSET